MPDFPQSPYQGPTPNPQLPFNPSVLSTVPGFENMANETAPHDNYTLEEIMNRPAKTVSFIPGTIPYSEVERNKRYAYYVPTMADMEDYAAHGQPWYKQLGNSLVKFGAFTIGTFGEGFFTLPSTISAIASGSFSKLYSSEGEQAIDNWYKNLEDIFPNYYSSWEREHPFLSAVPFVHGSEGFTNFWGDKVIKNLGFTAGAIGSAAVQSALVGAISEGTGAVPILATRLGQLSLRLQKLFTGTNDVAKVLEGLKATGATGEALLSAEKVATSAAGIRLGKAIQYQLALYGSARTEGAVEARDGYNTVKQDLIDEYKSTHGGVLPSGSDMDEIESYAKASANWRMAGNLVLLGISNHLQFDNILKTFSGAKGLRSSAMRALDAEGVKLAEGSVDQFTLEGGVGKTIWRNIKKKLPEIISEGPVEEGGQFALQEATKKYYEDKYGFYKNPSKDKGEWNSLDQMMKSATYGLGQEFGTNEGLENVLLGALTSVITGGFASAHDKLRGIPGGAERIMSALNSQSLTGTFANHYKDASNSLAALQDIEKAVADGNVFEFKNLKHKEFVNFIQSALKAGQFDVRIDQLKMLNELSQEEFEKLFAISATEGNRKSVQEYVGKLISQAEQIRDSWNSIDNTFTNPYRQSRSKDKTIEEAIEGKKYDAFEDYKTQLLYLTSITQDTRSRTSSIKAEIAKLAPNVQSDLVQKVMSDPGLKEMRDGYLEQSKIYTDSADALSGDDRKKALRQAQDFKNMAEYINDYLKDPNDTSRGWMFDQVMHFEMNGKTTDRTNTIPLEKYQELAEYGADLNRLDNRRQDADNYIRALSTEEGFNDYFSGRMQAALDPRETDVFPAAEKPTFDVGRVYAATKNPYRSKRMPDGRWVTLDQDGSIINDYPGQKEAQRFTKEMNNNARAVKVLQTNKDGTIKVEQVNGDIVDMKADHLKSYTPIETKEERQKKAAAKNKAIKETEDPSPVNTPPPEVNKGGFETPKKSDILLFASTVAPNEDWSGTLADHHFRSNFFGARLDRLDNKDNVRAIIINEKVEERYGLKGLTALSRGGYTPKGGWNESNQVLTAVMAREVDGKYFFVDAYGNTIGQLGEPIDLNKVVFQTMPAASTTYEKSGKPRYRNTSDPKHVEAINAKYLEWRKKMLGTEPNGRVYKVRASFGFLKQNEEGYLKRYHVNTITDNPTIKVATTSDKTLDNEFVTINTTPGGAYLITDSTIEQLDNRKLTTEEQKIVYEAIRVITAYADRGEIKDPEVQAIMRSLKGMIYWGTPRNKAGKNSIWFDDDLLHFGTEGQSVPFTTEAILEQKKEIMKFIAGMYNNINATNLSSKHLNDPYYELIGFKGDEPQTRKWESYQDYLISPTLPDGTARSADETPLATTIPPILPDGVTDLRAQTRQGIYFALPGVDAEIQVKPPPSKKRTTPPPPKGGVPKGTRTRAGTAQEQRNDQYMAQNGLIDEEDYVKKWGVPSSEPVPDEADEDQEEYPYDEEDEEPPFDDEEFGGAEEEPKKETKPAGTKPIKVNLSKKEEDELREWLKNMGDIDDEPDWNPKTRIASQVSTTPENWAEVERWIKDILPGVPVYRVKNMLHVTGDTYAWGAFSEGAIYLYENADVGTYYHEAFHAVMRSFMSPAEVRAVRAEFRQRRGTFTDYITGETVAYADATTSQVDEELAEEFRKVVLAKGQVSFLGKIGRLFTDLWNWIKSLVTKRSDINTLFKKIQAGKYRNYTTGRNISGITDIDYAGSLINPDYHLSPGERFDIDQHLKSVTVDYLLGTNKGLFELGTTDIVKQSFFSDIKNLVYKTLVNDYIKKANRDFANKRISDQQLLAIAQERKELGKKLDENWPQIEKEYEAGLRMFGITFDENDVLHTKDDGYNGKEGYNVMKVDPIKKANMAVKLLLATLKKVQVVPGEELSPGILLQETQVKISSIGGNMLMEPGKAFVQLLDKLADTPNFDAQMQALVQYAQEDPNYSRLFLRLKGSLVKGPKETAHIDWDRLSADDLRLLIAFSKTFAKQRPNAIMHYILEDGTAVVRPANSARQVDQVTQTWISNMVALAKKGTKYLQYGKIPGTKKSVYYATGVSAVKLTSPEKIVKFMQDIGIDISWKEFQSMSSDDREIYKERARGIYHELEKGKEVIALNRQALNISGNLDKLAQLAVKVRNPEAESVFFNIDGDLQQVFIEKNYLSHFAETLNHVKYKHELSDTNFSYLLTDTFSANSSLMNKLFDKNGVRTNFQLTIGYFSGTVDRSKKRTITVDRLTRGRRLLQEFNGNMNGYYHLFEPADSTTQWMWNIGNQIYYGDLDYEARRWDTIQEVFKGYFIDEVNLIRDNRPDVHNPGKLRFFDGILEDALDDEIHAKKKGVYVKTAEKIYDDNAALIKDSIKEFILEKNADLKQRLLKYGVVTTDGKTYRFANLSNNEIKDKGKNFTEAGLDKLLLYRNANYMIAQQELFKTVLGDPHQSKEWLKRAKSFFSPRESTIHTSPNINRKLDEFYNKVGPIEGFSSRSIKLQPGEIGYTDFKDYISTITYQDIVVWSALYGDDLIDKESDSQAHILDTYNRELRIKASMWSASEEEQYQFDKSWERLHKDKYVDPDLRDYDLEIRAKGNPRVISAYYPLKPIVTGNKLDKRYNSVVLDKDSIAVLSYRMMHQFNPSSNILKLIDKMQEEGIGYVIFESGRKIGNEYSNPVYDDSGNFNTAPYKGIVNVPYETMGIQVQTTPKLVGHNTVGSQLSKLSTMDLLDAGKPIDYDADDWHALDMNQKKAASPLFREIMHNKEIFEEMQRHGYHQLLREIGVKEEVTEGKDGVKKREFKVIDRSKLAATLEDEMLRRDANSNMRKALEYFSKNELSLESTNMARVFRNILYSMVDRNILSQKVSGGPKVEISSALFESNRIVKDVIKVEGKPDKVIYSTTDLKEYEDEDGKRYMEVYISSLWLRDQLPKKYSDPSDKENYLSDSKLFAMCTPSVMKGIGFRIPTQALNSADVIVVKKFLPIEMGDAVVVPSIIVKKTGGDFDVDKLNTYLKNTYLRKGTIQPIPFLGIGKIEDMSQFLRGGTGNYTKEQLAELEKLEEERNRELKAAEKPTISLDFLTNQELIDTKEEKRYRADQKTIQDRFKELQKILKCL